MVTQKQAQRLQSHQEMGIGLSSAPRTRTSQFMKYLGTTLRIDHGYFDYISSSLTSTLQARRLTTPGYLHLLTTRLLANPHPTRTLPRASYTST